MLQETVPSHVSYLKESTGLAEDKFIIPTRIPSDLITAIDVGGLEDADIVKLVEQQRDYKAYIKGILEQAFKFEDWVEHSTGTRPTVKWRTYKAANILKSD